MKTERKPEKKGTVQLERRKLLKTGILGGISGAFLSANTSIASKEERFSGRGKRAIRFAHMTDVHIRPEYSGDKGVAYALTHIQNHKDAPEFIINSGDAVYDVMVSPVERCDIEWSLWEKITKQECSIPIHSCIGNHDVFGWLKNLTGATGDEPLFAKKARLFIILV